MSPTKQASADYAAVFGASIRRVIADLGITMRALASSSGLSRNTPHGLDRGNDPRLTTAVSVLGTIGDAVRTIREELGFPITRIAADAALDPSIVRLIEAGQCLDLLALQQLSGHYHRLAEQARAAAASRPKAA